MIHSLKLSISNAFIVRGERIVVVDTGVPGEAEKILTLIDRVGSRGDVSLILHTHGHSDHAGSTKRLQEVLRVPTAIHEADAAQLAAGDNGKLIPTRWTARFILPFTHQTGY